MAVVGGDTGRIGLSRPKRRVARMYSTRDGIPGARVESLLQTSDGSLWVGTVEGLAERTPGQPADGREFQSYTAAQGLSARTVGALAEDREGNLWIGTFGSGAMKMAHSGFTTYTEADGVLPVASLLESRAGEMCIVLSGQGQLFLGKFDGRTFVPIRPAWPSEIRYFGWGRGQAAAQDGFGEWWIATGKGLCRFCPSRTAWNGWQGLAKAIYTQARRARRRRNLRRLRRFAQDVWIGTIGLGTEDGLASGSGKPGVCTRSPRPMACPGSQFRPPLPRIAAAISGQACTTADWHAIAAAGSRYSATARRSSGRCGIAVCRFGGAALDRDLTGDDPHRRSHRGAAAPGGLWYGARAIEQRRQLESVKTAGDASMPPPAAASTASRHNLAAWAASSDNPQRMA